MVKDKNLKERVLHIEFDESFREKLSIWKKLWTFLKGQGGIKARISELLEKDINDNKEDIKKLESIQ